MKLNEIKDVSDYQRGDERDPRSPYYEDPFEKGIPQEFFPEMPSFETSTEAGQTKNGKSYNFAIKFSYDKSDGDQSDVCEYALNDFAGDDRFASADWVDQDDSNTGSTVTGIDYFMIDANYPVNDVIPTLNKYAMNRAEVIAEKNARSSLR